MARLPPSQQNPDEPEMILAMWSGPRNISTAMMRAWENRSDTTVVDEPFYAHFLEATGTIHPMRDEILADQETDFQKIVSRVCQKPDSGILYQKHITTHVHEAMPLDWLAELNHAFLIRNPYRVIKSYSKKRTVTDASDLGYEQQQVVFEAITAATQSAPVVIDSDRFLENPEAQLRAICKRLNIPFEMSMLSWPAGKRATDGIWEAHWYDAVRGSTGFQPATPLATEFSNSEQSIVDECLPYYSAFLSLAV